MAGKNRSTGSYSMKLFFLFIALAFIVGGCNANVDANNAIVKNGINNDPNDGVNPNPAAYGAKSTGSLQNGDVLIELTPIGIKNGKFEIGVSANTHSVDLAQFDLMQQAALEYGNKEAKPVSAPKLNGHHTSGTLIFELSQQPANFRIVINDIPAIEKRVFEWP